MRRMLRAFWALLRLRKCQYCGEKLGANQIHISVTVGDMRSCALFYTS